MKKIGNIVFSSVLIIFGIIIWVTSYSMKSLVDVAIGPGDVPRVLGIILVLLSSFQLFNEVKEYKKEKKNTEERNKDTEKLLCWNNFKLPITILLCIFFAAALEPFGFVLTSIVYLFCQILVYSEDFRKKTILMYLLIAVIAGILIYVIFVYGFTLRLPNGLLKGLF